MDRHGGVPQHRLRAGGGHHQVVGAIGGGATAEGIAEVPEVALHLLHVHFQIAHRRTGGGAPIHQVFAPVDQALLMQAHEGFGDGPAEAGIKGEPLPPPVDRITEPTQLSHDGAAALGLPFPGPLQEGVAAQFLLGDALRLELLLQDRLHGDRGVVGAGQAEHVAAPQPLEAHDRVDQGRVEGMAHVQAAGHVRRRDHHRERLAGGLGIGVEGAGLLPGPLPAGFGGGRVVGLAQGGGDLSHPWNSAVAPWSQMPGGTPHRKWSQRAPWMNPTNRSTGSQFLHRERSLSGAETTVYQPVKWSGGDDRTSLSVHQLFFFCRQFLLRVSMPA
jgi:hypothetical protein